MSVRIELSDHAIERLLNEKRLNVDDFRCLDCATKQQIQRLFLCKTKLASTLKKSK